MFEMEFPPGSIVTLSVTGSFHGGPLDGIGFMFCVPPDQDLSGLEVSLTTDDTGRYVFDRQPDPASFEAGFRYAGAICDQ